MIEWLACQKGKLLLWPHINVTLGMQPDGIRRGGVDNGHKKYQILLVAFILPCGFFDLCVKYVGSP